MDEEGGAYVTKDTRPESFVSHLGKRVSAPKAYFLGCVTEILTEDAMGFQAMVMREGFRRLSSDVGMFSLIGDDPL